MSETPGATSDISGAESDSFHRYTNSGSRGQFNCGGGASINRHVLNRGHPRDNNNNNSHNHRNGGNTGLNGGGSGGQRNSADWDRICVEEFIDEDFDFEGNLALFNKSAFYEMVDSREGHSITHTSDMNNSSVSSSLPHFIEGPDGVGIPLFTTPTQSSNLITTMTASTRTTLTITSSGSHYEDKHKINNTQTTTTSNNKSINQHNPTSSVVVTTSPSSSLAAAVTVHSEGNNFNVNVNNKQYYINSIKQRNNQYWYTCTGQRVPIFPLEQRQRLFNYLTTGLNLDTQISNKFQGITWGRFIESATRPLIDNIMIHLRQLNRTPQRIIHRPPARILIISNGSNHLGAVLSLNIARYLSTLGACVLLVTPSMHCSTTTNNNNSVKGTATSEDVSDEYPTDNSIMSTVYRQELHLLMNLAPKPNQYGLDDLDDEDDELDQYSDDGRGTDNENNHDEYKNNKQIPGFYTVNNNDNGSHTNDDNSISIGSSSTNIREHNDVDFDNMSCLNYSDISSIVDHSSVGRIWMSRMPGLKIIRRPNSVTKLPSGIRIDLVIIGHSDDSNAVNKDNSSLSSNTNLLFNWLRSHNSIGGIIHLTPSQSIVDSNILLRNAQHFVWVTELGLPILTPQGHSTSLSSTTTTSTVSIPPTETTLNSSNTTTNTTTSLTHLLIDVGLGRNIVRKLTGDLNLLPPYGLFDLGSVIPLQSQQPNSVQQQQISR
ncbi:unnamed protein product [Schistosoma spindalis]|nr:unnamed protein product [Schistosoma spindale]